jgi:hypothetical protein
MAPMTTLVGHARAPGYLDGPDAWTAWTPGRAVIPGRQRLEIRHKAEVFSRVR